MSAPNEQDIRRIAYGQILNNTAVRVTGTVTWNPGDLVSGTQETKAVTVTGAALGDVAIVSFSLDLAGLQLTGYVSSADTVTAVLQNTTIGNVNLGSGTLKAHVWKA